MYCEFLFRTYSILYHCSPFPCLWTLCYFSPHLANKNLSPQTIKTYFTGIHHMQITLRPEPRAFLSLPRLQLVQAGIQRTYAQQSCQQKPKSRLPITPSVLGKMQEQWASRASDPDIMLWAAEQASSELDRVWTHSTVYLYLPDYLYR